MLKKEEVSKYGLMGLDTMGFGSTIWLMGMEDKYMLMEIFMRVIGLTIKQMVKELISILMGRFMKVSGKMINSTAKVKRNGLMDPHTREIM